MHNRHNVLQYNLIIHAAHRHATIANPLKPLHVWQLTTCGTQVAEIQDTVYLAFAMQEPPQSLITLTFSADNLEFIVNQVRRLNSRECHYSCVFVYFVSKLICTEQQLPFHRAVNIALLAHTIDVSLCF